MARKIKGKNAAQKPPLSKLDKAIYAASMILCVAWGFTFFGLCLWSIPDAVAFADKSVIAYNTKLLVLLCELPLIMFFMFFPAVLLGVGIDMRQPIFGNKGFKPPTFAPVIKTYPLFSKEFRENLTDESKRKIRRIVKAVIIIFIVCALIFPFGIYPRDVLDEDNNFSSYNSFNQKTSTHNVKSADKLIIDVDRSRHSYGIQMKFVFDDEEYVVNMGSIKGMDRKENLEYMIYLKSFFDSDEYEITNIKRLDNLLYSADFTDSELALVYDLLDYKE